MADPPTRPDEAETPPPSEDWIVIPIEYLDDWIIDTDGLPVRGDRRLARHLRVVSDDGRREEPP